MVFVKDNQDQVVPALLNETVVSFNNLKLTLGKQGDVKIQTKGEWLGDIKDLYVIIDTAVTEAGWKNGQDKQ